MQENNANNKKVALLGLGLMVLGCAQFRSVSGELTATPRAADVPFGGEAKIDVGAQFSHVNPGSPDNFELTIERADGKKETVKLFNNCKQAKHLVRVPANESGSQVVQLRLRNLTSGEEKTQEVSFNVIPPTATLFASLEKDQLYPGEKTRLNIRLDQPDLRRSLPRTCRVTSEIGGVDVFCDGKRCTGSDQVFAPHQHWEVSAKHPLERGSITLCISGECLETQEKSLELSCAYPETRFSASLDQPQLLLEESTPVKLRLSQIGLQGNFLRRCQIAPSSEHIEVLCDGAPVEGERLFSPNQHWSARAKRATPGANLRVRIWGEALALQEQLLPISWSNPAVRRDATFSANAFPASLTLELAAGDNPSPPLKRRNLRKKGQCGSCSVPRSVA